jgi:glycosyltransferase involved in cell wall biosynthesis
LNLSVIILAFNEEKNLPACLASLRGLDCEIFVVDSGSTDRTTEIAREWGAQVFFHAFENYAAQRNWAQHHLPLAGEWLMHLDADERLTRELVTEINQTLRVRAQLDLSTDELSRDEAIDGYLICKRTVFMGRWIRYGGHYPVYHLRLYRRGKGICERRLYDQHFVVNGKIGKLSADYIDVLSSGINSWIERHTRWAELEARQSLIDKEKNFQVASRFFGNPIERRRWLRTEVYDRVPLFVRPFLYWVYRYFFRFGLLDGREGFVFHFLQGFCFRLLVDVKIDELRRNHAHRVSVQNLPAVPSLRSVQPLRPVRTIKEPPMAIRRSNVQG